MRESMQACTPIELDAERGDRREVGENLLHGGAAVVGDGREAERFPVPDLHRACTQKQLNFT